MAFRRPGFMQGLMEKIVSNPLRATFTVGTSILVLTEIIKQSVGIFPELAYLLFLVPFVPPFFIPRTAKIINERRAEHDFINDAEPYIFVAFPDSLSKDSLLQTQPDIVSDSAARHFNCSAEAFLGQGALPEFLFKDPIERQTIVELMIDSFKKNDGYGTISSYRLAMKPVGAEEPKNYLLNSVLRKRDGKFKWQGTLMKLNP
mgnify:CR=1 FL=1